MCRHFVRQKGQHARRQVYSAMHTHTSAGDVVTDMEGPFWVGCIQCRGFSHACEPCVCCIPLHQYLDIAMTQIKACCESIARSGFGTLQISDAMLQDYRKIVEGTRQFFNPPKSHFPLPMKRTAFSLLAPSIRVTKIALIYVSGFATGPRTRRNERLSSSLEALSSWQWIVLRDRSVRWLRS